MAGFIKSHSNYRLQTRHQTVDGGVILERDISTVGGANTFATGQATVYQSGNFVMVVSNGSPVARHVRKGSWLPSYDGSDTWDTQSIESHVSDIRGSVERKIELKNDFMDLRSFAYYGSLSDLVENTVCSIMRDFPYEIYLGKSSSGVSATTFEAYNPGEIDIIKEYNPSTDKEGVLGHFYNGGYNNYEVYEGEYEEYSGNPCPITSWSVTSGYSSHCEAYSTASGASFPVAAAVEIKYQKDGSPEDTTVNIYVFYNRDGSLYYNWKGTAPIHIRPKDSLGFYDAFTDGLDMFGKCLMGVYSGTRNVASFEVLDTEKYRGGKTVRTFTFPSGEGGYNIATQGMALEMYIGDLGKIAVSYDEYYTDNMYRMMTHESLKNLDWTRGFNGEESESQYVKTGEKFAAVIRVMGYVFDHEKSYIDSIGNVNTITYSERSNLSDYFLSDSLEQDGWIVNTIYPYKLTLLSGTTDVTDSVYTNYTASGQTSGLYSRSFSEVTDLGEEIIPYSNIGTAYYYACDSSGMTRYEIDGYSGQTYQVVSGNVYNVITDYSSNDAITIPDINNEFEKRLRINSRNILRKKGTVEAIESLLSIFGMRSSRWISAYRMSSSSTTRPDFDIEEFTTISPYIVDSGDTVHEHAIDWYNSCKTIPYYTGGRPSIEYIPYQGLPVAYRDTGTGRRLYPYFDSNGVYDGGMYYQMNGGWLRYCPYRFGTEEEMLSGDTNNVETMRDVMLVSDIDELIGQPRQNLYTGMIYYVNSTGGEFALINGVVYPLKTDTSNNKYFVVNVYGGAVSVGGELYENTIEVSDGTNPSGTTFYDLGLYEDGYPIRIYYNGDRYNSFTIREYLYEDTDNPYGNAPDSALIFSGGTYDGVSGNTNYFQLMDVDGYGKIGEDYWRQVKKYEELYKNVDSVTDKYTGNNPHFGKLSYDNGNEYIDRFRKLFKYPLDNDLFNTSCFPNITETKEAISDIGFDVYDGLIPDRKCHSFADIYDSGGTYSIYDIEHSNSLSGRAQEYAEAISGGTYDGVTSQVINTKCVRITFYIDSDDTTGGCYSKEAQEEIKYIQSKIMPYVEQLIPSTSIVEIRFSARETQ